MSATPEQHAAAVKTALNNALSPKVAYDYDEVPAPRPKEYVEFSVTRRFGGEYTNDGSVGTTSWRIITRYVSQASLTNARVMQAKTRAALEFVALTVGADTTTRINFETGEPIGSDNDGYFTGLDSWTYVL